HVAARAGRAAPVASRVDAILRRALARLLRLADERARRRGETAVDVVGGLARCTALVDRVTPAREAADAGAAAGRRHALLRGDDGAARASTPARPAAGGHALVPAGRAHRAALGGVHPALGQLPAGERLHRAAHAA